MCAFAFGARGRPEDVDSVALEEGVEGARELRVTIVDQEPHLAVLVVELHKQVARLLQHPGRVRLAGNREVLDAAAPDREEEST
jgi:hypothetical protein